jgi:hypothetical protein
VETHGTVADSALMQNQRNVVMMSHMPNAGPATSAAQGQHSPVFPNYAHTAHSFAPSCAPPCYPRYGPPPLQYDGFPMTSSANAMLQLYPPNYSCLVQAAPRMVYARSDYSTAPGFGERAHYDRPAPYTAVAAPHGYRLQHVLLGGAVPTTAWW